MKVTKEFAKRVEILLDASKDIFYIKHQYEFKYLYFKCIKRKKKKTMNEIHEIHFSNYCVSSKTRVGRSARINNDKMPTKKANFIY